MLRNGRMGVVELGNRFFPPLFRSMGQQPCGLAGCASTEGASCRPHGSGSAAEEACQLEGGLPHCSGTLLWFSAEPLLQHNNVQYLNTNQVVPALS